MTKKIKVMLVDDSALVRSTLSQVLSSDPEIEILATAADPYIAAKKLRKAVPDVMILDIEMPRMDGITFLKKIMMQNPIPVIICSTLVETGSKTAIRALEYGAVDIIQKPKVSTQQFFEEARLRITHAVKGAAQAKLTKLTRRAPLVEPRLTADAVLKCPATRAMARTTDKVVVIGASTGGTEAVREILEVLPHDSPGVVVVQHMPEGFTRSFAKRLNDSCRINVKEAADGDSVLRGHALIGPGNKHCLLKRSGARYYVEVRDGPLVARHRPSVDVLFRSATRYAGKNAVGVILTGMGDDGATGMKEMFDAGAHTIAQDEHSSVVYGMPKAAYDKGGVIEVLALDQIAQSILRAVHAEDPVRRAKSAVD
ncbi:MAG: chemotaxis response regulator protein-glutamate methylesterase [Gammaproteobacteria bacterium]|nr:chemotaxis response regulator protein-glutamate methylesterase [Gammaproteobacteria bacterium]